MDQLAFNYKYSDSFLVIHSSSWNVRYFWNNNSWRFKYNVFHWNTQSNPIHTGKFRNSHRHHAIPHRQWNGGHAQAAIYADNGNAPGTLLAKSSSDTITSNGWHDFTGFNVAITGGTPYWLACESDSGNLLWYYNNGGANYYQGTSGSYGTFPNPYTRGSISETTKQASTQSTPAQAPHQHQHQHRLQLPTPPLSYRVPRRLLEQQQLAAQAQLSTPAYQEQPNTHPQAPEQSPTSCYTSRHADTHKPQYTLTTETPQAHS